MYITHGIGESPAAITLYYEHPYFDNKVVNKDTFPVIVQFTRDQIGTQGLAAFAKSLFRMLNKRKPEKICINNHPVALNEGEFVTACNVAP